MKKIAIFFLFLLFFACVKEKAVVEAEEQIEVYTVGAFRSNASAEKSIGGQKTALWAAIGGAVIDKKV